MTLGQNLKSLRVKRGLTQLQLADATEISNGQISRIEREEIGNPELMTLVTIATALGCSIDELVFGENGRPTSSDIKMLLQAVERLTEDQQIVVRGFLRGWIRTCESDDMAKSLTGH